MVVRAQIVKSAFLPRPLSNVALICRNLNFGVYVLGSFSAMYSPLRFGEKTAPPKGAETLALGVVRIYGRNTLPVREWWHDPMVT